jgi:hypothetical protein
LDAFRMSDAAPDLVRDTLTDTAVTLKGQVRTLLRAYQRQLRAKPSTLQLAAMRASAIAAARYDLALRDLTISGATLAHYERVSRKALAAMHATFPKHPPQPVLSPLAAYLARGYGDDK